MNSKLIPSDLVPKCPECGGEMEPWIRSFVFLEVSFWKSQIKKYQAQLLKNKYKKVLFPELSAGTMTPMFIKELFWEMTYSLPSAYYISIIPKDAVVPREIEEKGLAINKDIARVFQDALMGRQKEVNEMPVENTNIEMVSIKQQFQSIIRISPS